MIKYFVLSQIFSVFGRPSISLEVAKANDSNVHNDEQRSMECAKYVSTNMQDAVAKLYIEKYYDQHAHNEVFPMILLHILIILFRIFSDH